jgi:hypothetical protein
MDACPVGAIFDSGTLPERWKHYADVNRRFFQAKVEDE